MDTALEEFYKIDNAYETINVLLFPGIENEKARLRIENRNIDENIFNNMDELLNVYGWLYSAMCKYTLYTTEGKILHTRRDDRRHTYQCMQSGINDSFLSTSLNLESSKYFQKKDGLVLMEFIAEDTVEHIDINEVLGEKSAYQEEREILYSPFLYLTLEPLTLGEDEKKIEDYHKNPPCGKCLISLKGSTINPKKLTQEEKEWLVRTRKELIAEEEIENVKKVWNAIRMNVENSCQNEIEQYIRWKQKLKSYLRELYASIKYEQKSIWENQREFVFIKDLQNRIYYTDCKRREYESTLQKYAGWEIVLGICVGIVFAFIMIGLDFIACKMVAILLIGLFTGVKLKCENKSLKQKLKQRTSAYLKYDELLNDWKYEPEKTEKMLEIYIIKMREIEKIDNKWCEEYTEQMIEGMSLNEEQTIKIKDYIK